MNNEKNIICMQQVSDLHNCRKRTFRKTLPFKTPVFLIIAGCICSILLCLPVLAEEPLNDPSCTSGSSNCLNQGCQGMNPVCCSTESGMPACIGQSGSGMSCAMQGTGACQRAGCSGNCPMEKTCCVHLCGIGPNVGCNNQQECCQTNGCSSHNFSGYTGCSGQRGEFFHIIPGFLGNMYSLPVHMAYIFFDQIKP